MNKLCAKTKRSIRKRLAQESGWNCFYCNIPLIPDDRLDEMCISFERPNTYGYAGKDYVIPDGFGRAQLEHKQPLARGGTNELDNLVLSCPNCNYKKGTQVHHVR